MLKKLLPRTPKKGRRYPIKRDEQGKTARQRAFRLFDRGYRPTTVAPMVDVTLATSYTYFRDWKKLPRNLDLEYRLWKKVFRTERGLSPDMLTALADVLGMSAEEVVERLQRPWGLLQLLVGRWPNPRLEQAHSEQERRLAAALRIVVAGERSSLPPEEITAWILELREAFRKRDASEKGRPKP